MLALVRRSILVAVLLLTGSALAGADESVAPVDAAAIQQVIQGQMNAFKVDDWNAAFAYAAPSIQTKFTSPQVFSQMVTQAYQPVYRPRGVEFRDVKAGEFGPTQEVFVVGPDGLSYLAYHPMQEEADGARRIRGCYLVRAEDESV